MKSKRLSYLPRLLLAAVLMLGALTGYVSLDCSGNLPVAGQPFMDLMKAKTSGYLTDEEFRRLKRQLLYRL